MIRQMLSVLFFSTLQPFYKNALQSRDNKIFYVEVDA